MVDPWSSGHYGMPEDESGLRLTRALTWVRSEPGDNGYARPIEALTAIVDLNKMEVVRIEDGGVVPLPPSQALLAQYIGNYAGTLSRSTSSSRGPELHGRWQPDPVAEMEPEDRLHAARGPRTLPGDLR